MAAVADVEVEGASPKMKNLMKTPKRMTTESWPRRKPWVNDSLCAISRDRTALRISSR